MCCVKFSPLCFIIAGLSAGLGPDHVFVSKFLLVAILLVSARVADTDRAERGDQDRDTERDLLESQVSIPAAV